MQNFAAMFGQAEQAQEQEEVERPPSTLDRLAVDLINPRSLRSNTVPPEIGRLPQTPIEYKTKKKTTI